MKQEILAWLDAFKNNGTSSRRLIGGMRLALLASAVAVFGTPSRMAAAETAPADVPRLCLVVTAEQWGKAHGNDADVLITTYRRGLKMEGRSLEELNDAWFVHMQESYTKDYGAAKAEEIMQRIRKLNNCH